jgi:hypothetical protein
MWFKYHSKCQELLARSTFKQHRSGNSKSRPLPAFRYTNFVPIFVSDVFPFPSLTPHSGGTRHYTSLLSVDPLSNSQTHWQVSVRFPPPSLFSELSQTPADRKRNSQAVEIWIWICRSLFSCYGRREKLIGFRDVR